MKNEGTSREELLQTKLTKICLLSVYSIFFSPMKLFRVDFHFTRDTFTNVSGFLFLCLVGN